MSLTKDDFDQIREIVTKATEPHFVAIKVDLDTIQADIQRLERSLDVTVHIRRIETVLIAKGIATEEELSVVDS